MKLLAWVLIVGAAILIIYGGWVGWICVTGIYSIGILLSGEIDWGISILEEL